MADDAFAVLSRVGRSADTAINTGITGALSALVNPFNRVATYSSNKQWPNLFPDPSDVIALYYKGGCNKSELAKALAVNAIQLPTGNGDYDAAAWWDRILTYNRPQIPLGILLRSYALGNRDENTRNDVIAKLGYRSLSDINAIANDSNSLSLDLIWQFRARNILSDDDVIRFMRHAGWNNEEIQKLLFQMSVGIDRQTAITLLNRGIISNDDITKYMGWEGVRDEIVQKQLKEMRWTWPVLPQIIQWGQLGAFDNDRASNLQLDDEKPDSFAAFAAANGQQWLGQDTPPQNWPTPNLSPADLAWRAHWRANDLPSAITMLHRLRPTGGPNGGPRVPGVTPYTDDDFAADLRALGIAPGRRDQLRAISYSLPRFTVFKQSLSAGILSKADVIERLQDTGYRPDVATLLADTWEHQERQKQVDKLRPIAQSTVKEAYRLGTITRQQAARGLYIVYLSDYQQIIDFMALPAEAQYSLALGNGFIELALTSIDADIAGELAKQAIEVIRKSYLRLEIDATQASGQLYALGIVPLRAQQYIQLWTAEHAASGLEATAQQLRDWYINHLIDQPTYATRLSLLGYGIGDIAMMVARANLDISERAARLQAQTVKAQQLQAKQLAAAAKALAGQQKAIQRQMCSSGTRSQVSTWAIKGLLSYPDALKRLTECGMNQDDAIRLLTDKQPKKGGLTYEQVSEKVFGQPALAGTK